jgi:hypothetical protein
MLPRPVTLSGCVLTALLLCRAPALAAEPALGAPVLALRTAVGLVLITEVEWLLAEVGFPGQGIAPVTLGPSFAGAHWSIEGGNEGERLELAWVSPGGSGGTLSLPIDDGDSFALDALPPAGSEAPSRQPAVEDEP